jgi:hypothetical protein
MRVNILQNDFVHMLVLSTLGCAMLWRQGFFTSIDLLSDFSTGNSQIMVTMFTRILRWQTKESI